MYHLLATMSCVSQQLALDGLTKLWQFIIGTWEFLELENWEPNKFRALFLNKRSKENLTFFKVVTSFWVKLVPFWMDDTIGTRGLTIAYFFTRHHWHNIQVIGTKPMFMVFKWCNSILYPKTWVTGNKNSTYIFVKIGFYFAFEPHDFLECRTLNCKIGWATFNMPLAINTNNFLHL